MFHRLTLFLAAVAILGGGRVFAGGADGAVLYAQHCAPCHGRDGRGNGPDAALLLSRPRNLREGFLQQYSTDDLAERVREGNRLELALYLPALRERATETEAVVAHLQRLPAIDWVAVEPGWATYIARCEACHGAYGRPPAAPPRGVRAPRDFADPAFQRAMTDAELVVAVRHGHAGMPALTPRLGEEHAHEVAAFVRILSPGFEIYTSYCANCHGDRGLPIGDLEGAPRVPGLVFNRAYFARRDPEELRAAVWHMLADQKPTMPHFGAALSREQARAIIEYLKRTERGAGSGTERGTGSGQRGARPSPAPPADP